MSKFELYRIFPYALSLLVMVVVMVASMAFSRTSLNTLATLLITAFSLYYITRIHITYFKLGVVEEGLVKLLPRPRTKVFREVLVNLLFLVMLGGLLEHTLMYLVNNVYLSLAISAVVLVAVVNALKRARWKRKTTYISILVLVFFTILYFMGLINDHNVEHFEHSCKLLEEVLHGT